MALLDDDFNNGKGIVAFKRECIDFQAYYKLRLCNTIIYLDYRSDEILIKYLITDLLNFIVCNLFIPVVFRFPRWSKIAGPKSGFLVLA